MQIEVKIELKDERLAGLLCSALEGGSNYWYMIQKFNKPTSYEFRTDKETLFRHLDYPMNPGGSLVFTTTEEDEINGKTEWTLDRAALEAGFRLMAAKYPQHMANVLDESDDSITGDVFLQCCLFGEVVFG